MSTHIVRAMTLVLLGAAPLSAQGPSETLPRLRHGVGAVIGVSQFDLSGTGNTLFVGARAETELQRWLIGEAALGVFRPEEQFLTRATYFSPELQLQLQLPTYNVRPYIGAGVGYWFAASKRASSRPWAGWPPIPAR